VAGPRAIRAAHRPTTMITSEENADGRR
jgi:hypothetical protein